MITNVKSILDIIIIVVFIAEGIYLNDKYNILSKKVENLSKLISEKHINVDYETLRKLNLSDEDIKTILKLVDNDEKLKAIKFLTDVKNINHLESYNIINKLIGGRNE